MRMTDPAATFLCSLGGPIREKQMNVMHSSRLAAAMRVVLPALVVFLASLPASAAEAEKASSKDMVLNGDAKCTKCHDESDDAPVLAIGKTRHGTRADKRTPSCVSCHGESDKHMNKPADAKERPHPDIMYGKKSQTTIDARNSACLTCHTGGKRIQWVGSKHSRSDVACSSCHQVHTGHDKARDKLTEAEVCFACHKEQRAQMNLPSRHPIREGKVVCSDCHNPHGSVAPVAMVRDTINDTCFTCHMEKRGPFVRNHPPATDNCAVCHNPHGTTTPAMLKERPPFLCQQCHEPTSIHRGAIPTTATALNTPQSINRTVLLARGCVNCHTDIHGSNNPTNTTGERTFRR
jgi:DmsE family decaheme c-type cytochrome